MKPNLNAYYCTNDKRLQVITICKVWKYGSMSFMEVCPLKYGSMSFMEVWKYGSMEVCPLKFQRDYTCKSCDITF